MSNIYIKEPPTSGKVLLETTAGDIDIELWCRECPKACRNFIQLCMEKYYDNTVFHRLVPNFLIQGGDPTGTGDGGESIYGKPFKDEFHTRLKFERRGLVGMASVEPNSNQSQFFFTLSATPELTKKNTLFGKVEGNTLYNMLALGDMGADEEGRPNKRHKILRTEILNNPFDDIEPRQIERTSTGKGSKPKKEAKQKEETAAVKNYSLLSFGDEAEEDEMENEEVVINQFKGKSKSAHDRLKNDPKLLSEALQCESTRVKDEDTTKSSAKKRPDSSDESSNDDVSMKKKTKKSRRPDDDSSEDEDAAQLIAKEEKLRQMREEADKMLAELNMKKLQKMSAAKDIKTNTDAPEADKTAEDMYSTSYMKKYRHLKTVSAKTPTEKAAKQDQTMKMLADFESKLKAANQLNFAANYEDDEEEEEAEANSANDVTKDGDSTKQNLDSASWMTHKFQVESELKQARDANVDRGDDEYEIFDPRNPMNKRRREKAKQAMRDRRKPLAGVKDIG